MLFRNVEFLVFRVARNFDHFHTVEKRSRNRLECICRRDKHNFRQIQRYFQIMVSELSVLLGVEHFQKSGKSISLIVCTHLVDFIQQKNRVFHSRRADSVGDSSRHRAHIRLSMSSDLRLVPHSSEGDSYVRLVHRFCERPGDGSLSCSRRSRQAEDRAFPFLCEHTHCQVFENPLLHLLQTVVLLVQNLLGLVEICAVFHSLLPRHLEQRLDISADHTALSRRIHGTLKPVDFLLQLFLHFLRSFHLFERLLKLFCVRHRIVVA